MLFHSHGLCFILTSTDFTVPAFFFYLSFWHFQSLTSLLFQTLRFPSLQPLAYALSFFSSSRLHLPSLLLAPFICPYCYEASASSLVVLILQASSLLLPPFYIIRPMFPYYQPPLIILHCYQPLTILFFVSIILKSPFSYYPPCTYLYCNYP